MTKTLQTSAIARQVGMNFQDVAPLLRKYNITPVRTVITPTRTMKHWPAEAALQAIADHRAAREAERLARQQEAATITSQDGVAEPANPGVDANVLARLDALARKVDGIYELLGQLAEAWSVTTGAPTDD